MTKSINTVIIVKNATDHIYRKPIIILLDGMLNGNGKIINELGQLYKEGR